MNNFVLVAMVIVRNYECGVLVSLSCYTHRIPIPVGSPAPYFAVLDNTHRRLGAGRSDRFIYYLFFDVKLRSV